MNIAINDLERSSIDSSESSSSMICCSRTNCTTLYLNQTPGSNSSDRSDRSGSKTNSIDDIVFIINLDEITRNNCTETTKDKCGYKTINRDLKIVRN